MAPIKFDENIKDKLEKRVLTPSPEAWDRLSGRLDDEQKSGKKQWILWLGVAASIVGVLFFSTQFFKESTNDQLPIITDADSSKTQEIESKSKPSEAIFELEISTKKKEAVVQNEMAPIEKKNSNSSVEEPISEEKKSFRKEFEASSPKTLVAANTEEQKEVANQLSPEDIKVNEVVAEINALKEKGQTVSDEELDELLKQAERELLKDKLYNETTKTVDANALLQDVEEDLDQSFRAKVFDALKNGYDSVRTAVANRNN